MSKLDLIAPDSPEAALSRRSLVQTIAGTALAMTFLAGCGGSDDNDNNNNGNNGSSNLDVAVLQFALHLEYLEAEFYSRAVNGTYLSDSDTTTGSGVYGATTGGAKTVFTSQYGAAIAAEIANDEVTHVRLLRTALSQAGSDALIKKPAINLDALGPASTSEASFITLARAFEDVGVTAYLGAAPVISKTYLATAGAILAVEALHTGNLRLQAVQQNNAGADVDGASEKDQVPTATNFFNTTNTSLAYARTPVEVLRIVLGQAGATGAAIAANPKGGFFPNGLNLTGNNAARLIALGG